jgi:hypothetical protein
MPSVVEPPSSPSTRQPTPAEIMNANPPPAKPGAAVDASAPVEATAPATPPAPPPRVPNAERVIAALNAQFSTCYSRGLTMNPRLAGRGVVTLVIGPTGDVESTSFAMNEPFDATTTACLTRAVAAAKFDHPVPEGGRAKLDIPIVFSPEVR